MFTAIMTLTHLPQKLYDEYYIGWADIKLPHKFKIGIGGCPNSCVKPALNDFGIEGHRIPKVQFGKLQRL